MSRRSATIDEETADNLSEAELKAAKANPAGDTEHSGAAPGAKGDDSTPAVLKEPKSAVDARERAREDTEEVRDQQWDVQKQAWTNARVHKVTTIYADVPDKGDPETLVFAASDDGLTLYASSPEMRFGRDNATALQRELAKVWATL